MLGLLRITSATSNIRGSACFCSISTPTASSTEQSKFSELASSESIDATSPYVIVKGEKRSTPKEAGMNLLGFLNRSDVVKRKINMHLPLFLSGSYLSVTKADPYSPSGESTFAGICISRRKIKQLGSTFILRNVINGMGVEMMYELYSPALKEIKVLKLERRRRAKLYYLRDKPPKYSTVNEKMVPVKTPKGPIPLHRRKGAPA